MMTTYQIAAKAALEIRRRRVARSLATVPALEPISLRQFIEAFWAVVEPAVAFVPGWHIDAITEHLTAVTRGEIRRLVINVPPGFMKSLTICVFWPAWVWAEIAPSSRWIFASYSRDFAKRDSRKCRQLIRSFVFQERYGRRWHIMRDQDERLRFENSATGFRMASSVEGSATGERGDYIVVDDPLKITEAESVVAREAVNSWYRQEMLSRGTDPATARHVIVMQRLHEHDLSGVAIQDLGFDLLKIPMRFRPTRRCTTRIGYSDPRQKEGEIAWKQRYGEKEDQELRTALGSRGYAAQCDQEPTSPEGNLFKRLWFKYWVPSDHPLVPVHVPTPDGKTIDILPVWLPKKFDEQIQSWDLTFKNSESSKYVAGQAWGKLGAMMFLLHQIRDRMDFLATIRALRMMTELFPDALAKLIEDKANGPAILNALANEIGGMLPVLPEGSKVERANAVLPLFEAGNIYLPHPMTAPWVEPYIEEMVKFPEGEFNDQVDATTQAVAKLSKPQKKVPVAAPVVETRVSPWQ